MTESSRNATLTHQLRNQLNNIAMNAELAKMELMTPDDTMPLDTLVGTPLECVDAILRACAECAEITDALSGLNDESTSAYS